MTGRLLKEFLGLLAVLIALTGIAFAEPGTGINIISSGVSALNEKSPAEKITPAEGCGPIKINIIEASSTDSINAETATLKRWYTLGETCYVLSFFEVMGTGKIRNKLVLTNLTTGRSSKHLLGDFDVDSCSWEPMYTYIWGDCAEVGLFKAKIKYKRLLKGKKKIWKASTKFRISGTP